MALTVIQEIEREQINAVVAKRGVPEFGPGDTVKVMVKVIEGGEGEAGQGRRQDRRPRQGRRAEGGDLPPAGLRRAW
jgi:ribosomal protein L19